MPLVELVRKGGKKVDSQVQQYSMEIAAFALGNLADSELAVQNAVREADGVDAAGGPRA